MYLYDFFLRYVKQFKKTRLIAHIIWERERFARDFFDNYQPFGMSRFLAYNFLIKHLMMGKFDGTIEANESNTVELVKTFDKYLERLADHIYLKEGFGELVADMPFDPSSLTIQEKLSRFRITYTEDFLPLSRTYANNQIYSEEEGKKIVEGYRPEWERIKEKVEGKQGKKIAYNPRVFIHNSYPILNALYCGLIKNEIYAETFDFKNYEGLVEEPSQIMDVANGFLLVAEYATVTPLHEYRKALKRVFKGKAISAEPILLLSEKNTATFPLFILLEGNVFISHRTAFLIFALLHPILLKDYFHDETVKRSKELETTRAKDAFEKAGYTWVPSVRDRKKSTLEIDGLAGRNGALFVVEVKGWGLTTFYEHKNKHEQLVRDLKGIVDGKKYRMKGDKLIQEKIPSLLEKIEYAKLNMNKHGLDSNVFKTVKGVIVIEDFPPITEYEGVRIIGLEDVSSLR